MSATTPPVSAPGRTFTQLLSSTRRGARLARLLAADQLRTWGLEAEVVDRAEHVVAELATNAVFHGRVHGRDFRLGLTHDAATGRLRIEVTDARGDRRPGHRPAISPDDESGRGLLLVAAYTDCWGTDDFPPSGKTVWAEITVSTAGSM